MVSSLAMQKSPRVKIVKVRNVRFLENYNPDEGSSHRVVIEKVQDFALQDSIVEPGGHIPTMAQQLPI